MRRAGRGDGLGLFDVEDRVRLAGVLVSLPLGVVGREAAWAAHPAEPGVVEVLKKKMGGY